MRVTKTDKIGLTEKQLKALPFLIAAPTESDACRQAKISRQTYYDWLKSPKFKVELNRLRNLVVDDAVVMLKGHTNKAVATLVALLDSSIPSLQRNVANDILQHVAKFKELHEIEDRVQSLENQINQEQESRK